MFWSTKGPEGAVSAPRKGCLGWDARLWSGTSAGKTRLGWPVSAGLQCAAVSAGDALGSEGCAVCSRPEELGGRRAAKTSCTVVLLE